MGGTIARAVDRPAEVNPLVRWLLRVSPWYDPEAVVADRMARTERTHRAAIEQRIRTEESVAGYRAARLAADGRLEDRLRRRPRRR